MLRFFTLVYKTFGIFSVCAPPPPPQLIGCTLFAPPDARAIFLHNDLQCKGTCSVTGGRITDWGGGTNGKDLTLVSTGLLVQQIYKTFVPTG